MRWHRALRNCGGPTRASKAVQALEGALERETRPNTASRDTTIGPCQCQSVNVGVCINDVGRRHP